MPPTKRKASGNGGGDGDGNGMVVAERRVTRGQTRQLLLNNSGLVSQPPPPPKKKVNFTDDAKVKANAKAKAKAKATTVVIEHCKQCNRFKVRAHQVQKGLEEAVPGITVLINPEKPRRGCFEIRMEGGQTFISLLDLKRPFKPMTDLNMEEVIADIIGKIKA